MPWVIAPPPFVLKKGDLTVGEVFWRDHYNFFLEHGYQLRDRYKPDWTPSWDPNTTDDRWRKAEDAQNLRTTRAGDATRLSDGTFVVFKVLDARRVEQEVDVANKFSSEPLASDPRNHCVPIYDVLTLPEEDGHDRVLVMPLLRLYNDPPFDTIGEVVAMFKQIFEGLYFMHLNHTAHRDCTNNNIMMDPTSMYPESFHPARPTMRRDHKGPAKYYTRTQCPPKYYLIDFGFSRTFSPGDGPPRMAPGDIAGDKTLPEFKDHPKDEYDPFAADVYYIGNWVREWFMNKYHGFDFMQPLVKDMVERDPAKRPTMEQVMPRLDTVIQSPQLMEASLSGLEAGENVVVGMYRSVAHWKRQAIAGTGTPSVPK